MKQRTHTWLAIRAIALLEDAGETPGLVKILKPHVKESAIGSWIPDLADSKKGSGDIDYHIFKMKPFNGAQKQRFVTNKAKLFQQIGSDRKVKGFIQKWGSSLESTWWDAPYKAEPRPGEHLANRSMALTTAIADQLILGDPDVARLVPGSVRFASKLASEARTRKAEVATYFFMLSHFLADSCQPCHCDARTAFGYSNGLHKEMESHWNKIIGTYFEKKKLFENTDSAKTVLQKARDIDTKFSITFANTIPDLGNNIDAWLEIVRVCRASFAVASILVPPAVIPYGNRSHTSFKTVFEDTNVDPSFLTDCDEMIMHDAVLNIAIIWKSIWQKFS
ncbi:MAG: hypothetical protein OEU84_13215 [Xanthomonadales bacterium]|nr:hypothetical protein [Xanthomonadales bacterium]